MKSAIIYVKGSTENELNWQIFALVKWCVKNDYEIKGIYKEHASFFSNKNEILNSIINNEDKADIIVLYDISVIPSEKGGDDKRWSCPSEIQTIARNMPIYSLKEKKEFKVNDSEYEYPIRDIGLSIDPDKTLDQIKQYQNNLSYYPQFYLPLFR